MTELVVLFEMGDLFDDVTALVHARPTLSEVIGEAAMRAQEWAIHI